MSHGLQDESLFRIGFGTDLHSFKPGGGFSVGGVFIPCPFALEAVSDGDVLLHALVDALAGACGWGDIGAWFPEKNVRPNQNSSLFILAVADRMRGAGHRIVNVDCVVNLQNVRLESWKEAIRHRIAELLDISPGRVNVKAKTAERLGPVGEGRAISAEAVALVRLGGEG